jgi:hypothetical protein
LFERSISTQVPVDARCGRRIDEILVVRVNGRVPLLQFLYPAELVLLMIVLRPVKPGNGNDLGPDAAFFLIRQAGLRLQRRTFLVLVVVKDDRCILWCKDRCLRAVAVPKDVQQFLIGDLAGVVIDLYRLRVATDAGVGGVLALSSSISNARADDSGYAPEPGVWTPESTKGKGGCLDVLGRGGVDRGNCRLFG